MEHAVLVTRPAGDRPPVAAAPLEAALVLAGTGAVGQHGREDAPRRQVRLAVLHDAAEVGDRAGDQPDDGERAGDGVGDRRGEPAAPPAQLARALERRAGQHGEHRNEQEHRARDGQRQRRVEHREGRRRPQDGRHAHHQRGDSQGDPVAHRGEVVGRAGDRDTQAGPAVGPQRRRPAGRCAAAARSAG
ncbi:hypothetical protein [Georgenia sp. AZ-5]|uniref:hypothetical protein n=1 Tax=Georgenia sp. AZ-5 TaxID=3367526 RepID=UPI0037543E81